MYTMLICTAVPGIVDMRTARSTDVRLGMLLRLALLLLLRAYVFACTHIQRYLWSLSCTAAGVLASASSDLAMTSSLQAAKDLSLATRQSPISSTLELATGAEHPETGKSRLAKQPRLCTRRWIGRFCHMPSDQRAPGGWYDECYRSFYGQPKHQRVALSTRKVDGVCPVNTWCTPAPIWEHIRPLIMCVRSQEDVRRAFLPPVTPRVERAEWNDLELRSRFERDDAYLASIVIDTSTLHLPTPQSSGVAGPSQMATMEHLVDISVGQLGWPVSNVVGMRLSRQPPGQAAPHESPARRPIASGFAITRNDDPQPLCVAKAADAVCASTSETPLHEGDILHLALSPAESMNDLLAVFAFDSSVYPANAPPEGRP